MSSPISLHVVLDNVPQKNYPNYHVKLPYQYRIKLEMSNNSLSDKRLCITAVGVIMTTFLDKEFQLAVIQQGF